MIDKLSIIIPTLNEEKYLPRLLTSIAHQHFKGKLQVVVVDGTSIDNTIKVVMQFKKRIGDLIVITTPRGTAYQRNRGVEKAIYNYLLFIDADMILPQNMLNTYTRDIDPTRRIVGRVLFLPAKSYVIDYLFFLPAYLCLMLMSFFSPITSGGFIFTTKENHQKIHGFTEGGILGEDLDYGERSVKDGALYYFSLKTYVFHSSRRAQHMGRVRLFIFLCKSYFYFRRNGIIYDSKKFYYPYGEYKGDY